MPHVKLMQKQKINFLRTEKIWYNDIIKAKEKIKMYYVTSDLHGCPADKFLSLLDKAGFGNDDYLFVLGDVIDRGEDGIKLLKWIISQPNVELILGNHEVMMFANRFLIDEISERSIGDLKAHNLVAFTDWMSNGGDVTLEALKILHDSERKYIFRHLEECPLYLYFTLNGQKFILTHSGFGNFSPDREFEEYSLNDLVWHRPQITERFYEDAITIFGHTPTLFYGEEFKGKAIKTDTWINIDTGAAMGLSPMLLRLDDMQEFYIDD